MNKFRLAEVSNLEIHPDARKLTAGLYEFLACLLSEYAIGYLKFDSTDNSVYPSINKYFAGGEISSRMLIDKLQEHADVRLLLDEFPPVGKNGTFNYAQWNSFLLSATWETTKEENIFYLNSHKYVIPQNFLNLYVAEDGVYAQRYCIENGQVYFKNIGNGQYSHLLEAPYQFSGIIKSYDKSRETLPEIEITQEEFFAQSEQLKSLDAEQHDAITYGTEKNLLILAGAGSGKPRTLVCRFAYLHLVQKIPLNRILLLTFTTSAAMEMRKRSLELLSPIYSKFRPLETPNVNSRTIDSLIIHLLDTYYLQMGFTVKPVKRLDDNDDTRHEKEQMLETVILENKLQGIFKYYFDEKTGRVNQRFRWLASNLMAYACGLPINCAGFEALLRLYLQKQREMNRVMGFTEASLFVREAICAENSPLREIVASRYSCILIDEFQDVNVLQNKIFEPLYFDTRIHFTFVGDDDQSIYYWRGSDHTIINNLLQNPNVHTTYLLTNYRNNPNIVKAGNAVLRTIRDRAKKSKPIRPNRQTGAKIRVATYDDKYTNLVNEIDRLLAGGQEAEEICILSRNRDEGTLIARALRAADLPVARARIDVDLNDDYKLMKAILNVINENHITASIREIVRITDTHDVTDRYVQKVVLGQCEEFECIDSLKEVKALSRELCQGGIKTLDEAVYRYSLKAAELFENVLNDRHSNEIFEIFEDFCKNSNAPWPVPRRQLKELFATFEDHSRNDMRHGDSLSNGIKISTIHAAKGLEYNVVIITGLADGQYPSTAQINNVYAARNAQLDTLNVSRENYYRLKQRVSPAEVSRLIMECVSPVFTRKEYQQMTCFKKEIISMQVALTSLTADGVEEYLDSYRYYVSPLELQYHSEIDQHKNAWLVEKSNSEALKDKLLILGQENSAEVRECKKELEAVERNLDAQGKKILKLQDKEQRFLQAIRSIKEYYNICLNASGLLADMDKADEIVRLRAEAELEKEQRINEERRLYYVAITRARDFLYLCHKEGTAPSEFIRIIGDELKTEHMMLTKEEERECQRLTDALHKETKKDDVNDVKVQEHVESLLSQRKFQSYIKMRSEAFNHLHKAFASVCAEALPYYNKAIGLLFIAEIIGGDFKTEFAHNMQRVSEITLQQYAGSDAKPFKTEDTLLAKQIVDDILKLSRTLCVSSPAPTYLRNLITIPSSYGDELSTLKSSGIMHYIVRSKKYLVESSIIETWENSQNLENGDQFLAAALDLANIRNVLVHGGKKGKWPEDPIPMIIHNTEILVMACQKAQKHLEPTEKKMQVEKTVRTFTDQDIQIGARVKHDMMGEGAIIDLTSTIVTVSFDDGNQKMFLKSSLSRYFTLL